MKRIVSNRPYEDLLRFQRNYETKDDLKRGVLAVRWTGGDESEERIWHFGWHYRKKRSNKITVVFFNSTYEYCSVDLKIGDWIVFDIAKDPAIFALTNPVFKKKFEALMTF